jgi:hypothetical protein
MGMAEFYWDGGLEIDISRPADYIIGSEGGIFVHCVRLSFVPGMKVCTLVASHTYWNAAAKMCEHA